MQTQPSGLSMIAVALAFAREGAGTPWPSPPGAAFLTEQPVDGGNLAR